MSARVRWLTVRANHRAVRRVVVLTMMVAILGVVAGGTARSLGAAAPAIRTAGTAGAVLAKVRANGCPGTRAVVNGVRTCLRLGRRCSHAYRADYLSAGRDCVRSRGRYVLRRASFAALRQGRVLALPPSGLPSFTQALWDFDRTVAPLPGVHVPAGAVGREASGTGAIAFLDRFRNRLTRRQRAVLNRVLNPAGPLVPVPAAPALASASVHAVSAAGLGDLPAIVGEAKGRLAAHGMVFKHPIALKLLTSNKGLEQMNTLAQWLYGGGSNCLIEVRPSGARAPLIEKRRFVLHELMHCAAAEQVNNRTEFDREPAYVDEGLPEWGAYRVAMEWQGALGGGDWWSTYLDSPQLSLLTRSYDAVGFWSLLEHEGVNVWGSQPALVKHGATGSAAAALQAAEAAAPPTFESDWGTTLATKSALGPPWDLAGPGMPPRTEPSASLGNGDAWGHAVGAAGAYEGRVDISADVIRVQSVSSVRGQIRDSAGNDQAIPTDQRFCTDGNGCQCPDGTKLGYTALPPGETRIGFADAARTGSVVITGESLDQHCKTRHKGGLEILVEPGLSVLATFRSGTCSVAKGRFEAKAKDGAWSIEVHIGNFGKYSQVYTLQHGTDPGFTLKGPRGTYSNAFAAPNHAPEFGQIHFGTNPIKMSLGFEYAWNASGTDAVLPLGVMNCTRPKR
jgi:hypothetical protein